MEWSIDMLVSSDELHHHGIKGQKWGIRRFQNKDGSFTPAGRKRYSIGKERDGIQVLKKGSEVHRVTTNPNSQRKGHAYVSFMDADVKGYQHEITRWRAVGNKNVKTYDLTMKLTKDLRIAGENEKAKAFVKLVENQKVDYQSMYLVQSKYSDSNGKYTGRLKNVRDRWVKQGMDLDMANAYTLFAMSLYESPQNRNALFTELSKKGYGAIEDMEDSFSHRMKPLIVFERENTLEIVNYKELPKPDTDSEGWKELIKQAEISAKKTDVYHRIKGVKPLVTADDVKKIAKNVASAYAYGADVNDLNKHKTKSKDKTVRDKD